MVEDKEKGMSKHNRPLKDRILDNTVRIGHCLIRQGAKTYGGYPRIRVRKAELEKYKLGKCFIQLASRVQWVVNNGPIPRGIKVLHSCDNPSCIRRKHLFLGTSKDNTQDMINKGRKPVGDLTRPKLSLRKAKLIRSLKRKGFPVIVIAEKFHVSETAVYNVINNKFWIKQTK